ncbi:hypothetical alanine rich protein [Mycobacteroides abscessus subsp. abscessus]|uniref:MinD/ParA family ATP-binding protein n=1 Tax=Mycobacteroides abscessus TaxID=36809 RepID=UPI0009261040|nr:MinD/ParA family protein [Mycobacteroides abscessus]SIJ22117.1 hypothetical alanine rich protein [Mycobacteroides abscessus subsp. abscessus]SLH38554.1 hypothetical alanine rich protein [Mycobacteroides abscessus subsp. abscessus]
MTNPHRPDFFNPSPQQHNPAPEPDGPQYPQQPYAPQHAAPAPPYGPSQDQQAPEYPPQGYGPSAPPEPSYQSPQPPTQVEVGVIDSGVTPQPRVPVRDRGDWSAAAANQQQTYQPQRPAVTGPVSAYSSRDGREELILDRREDRERGHGWRYWVSKLSFGQIKPGPSAKQEEQAQLIATIRAALMRVHNVAFINLKGGTGKTTVTAALMSAIAKERGDRVIAVDVNPDKGNLARKFAERGGPQANIEALAAQQTIPDYQNVRVHTVQNPNRLEGLGSQDDPASGYELNPQDYSTTMQILQTHYNVIALDCGTSLHSPLFKAIADDQPALVIVASQDVDGIWGGLDTLLWLRHHGYGHLLARTVVVLNAKGPGKPLVNLEGASAEFAKLVPSTSIFRLSYDPHLAAGAPTEFERLKKRTRKELMALAGGLAAHYPLRQASGHH